MKHLRAIVVSLVIVALAIGLGLGYGWLPRLWRAPAPPRDRNAPAGDVADEAGFRVLGWLEPARGLIDLNGIPGDRLETLLVDEGAVVAKGQPLAHLESRTVKRLQLAALESQMQEAVARREAEVQLAQSRVQTARLGVEKIKLQELDADGLRDKIQLLADNLAQTQKDYGRLRELKTGSRAANLPDPIVSEQELERQRLVVERAKSELAAAKADEKRFRATRENVAAAAQADLRAAVASQEAARAAAPVKALEGKLEMARGELALAEIKAPCAGRVLKTFVRPGETISQRPILRMANLDRMLALAEVYDVDVKRVRIGQPATVYSKAFHAPKDATGLRGKVVEVGRMVNTPELKSLNPFAKADRHVIPIQIEIAAEDCAEAGQFVDLQVDVQLHRE